MLMATSATFRFYGELNHFLAPGRRAGEFRADCAAGTSVRHMIEVLGVPHTEVALILVNGEAAGFGRLLQEGDRVAVYPSFRSPDFRPASCQGSAGPPRFVADAHLGALARLLRMAGFDTLYDNGYQDDELARIVEREGRILLSRDRDLLKRRSVSMGCYLHALLPEAQFTEIIARLDLVARLRPFSRCLDCNAPLRDVPKAAVLERLPPSVRLNREHFTTCDDCGGVFWQGSHWQRMRATLERALAGLPGGCSA